MINNELILNPTLAQLEGSDLDLTIVSTKDTIAMVEAGAKEVTDAAMLKACELRIMPTSHQQNYRMKSAPL